VPQALRYYLLLNTEVSIMLNRSFLVILGILSLGWIAYVALNLSATNFSPTPEKIFSEKDSGIVIVHKTNEIDYNQEAFAFLQEKPFFQQLLSKTERIQHYYFSTNRDIAILERSKPWSFDLIQKYFAKLQIGSNLNYSREIKLSNDWRARYHDNYLVLFKGELSENSNVLVNWKFIDRKCSASLINKTDDVYRIENTYFISSNRVKYISQTNQLGLELADDQDAFLEMIPSKFASYNFYEKSFAKQESPINSPLYDWIDKGFVVLETPKGTCIITDFIAGQSPFAILEPYVENDTDLANVKRVTTKKVPLPFSLFKGKKCTIELFNNYAVISDNEQVINDIIGSYETGNTLAQSQIKKEKLFAETPKKVSFRSINDSIHETISQLTGSTHRVIHYLNYEQSSEDPSANIAIPPIRIDGSVAHIIPVQNSSTFFAISTNNTLYCIRNNAILWQQTVSGQLAGDPALSLNGQALALICSDGLHVFTLSGNQANGFPVKGSPKGSIHAFEWKGQSAFACILDGQLVCYDIQGKKLGSVSIGNGANSETPITVIEQRGELIVHCILNGKWNAYNLRKKTLLKSIGVDAGEWYLVKNNGRVSAMGLVNKQFIKVGDNGKKAVMIGNVQNILRRNGTNELELLYLTQGPRIFVLKSDGSVLAQFETRVRQIQDMYSATTENGKTLVGILDGIANNSYIYTLNGNEISKEAFEGANQLVLQKQADGSLVLISESNTYLVCYPINE
jgi:hypothetical protein